MHCVSFTMELESSPQYSAFDTFVAVVIFGGADRSYVKPVPAAMCALSDLVVPDAHPRFRLPSFAFFTPMRPTLPVYLPRCISPCLHPTCAPPFFSLPCHLPLHPACLPLVDFMGGSCHRGLCQGAEMLLADAKGDILQQLAQHKGYRLVVTGHSLGGGEGSCPTGYARRVVELRPTEGSK